MKNYCINCGRDLRNAPYTAPWEDGDNEEGYWTCLRATPKILTGLPQMTLTDPLFGFPRAKTKKTASVLRNENVVRWRFRFIQTHPGSVSTPRKRPS